MSPFLFAIVMEYLSRCLKELAMNPDFNFHPRCERISLTHLMFADDLLMFARADPYSVKLMHDAFKKFSNASGLTANLDKSSIYFGGISEYDQGLILEVLPVVRDSLPFKYLGVPLTSKKLTVHQCKPLVDRVLAKVHSWEARMLSYAGRVQLIKSVLFGVQSYWTQIFKLPKKTLRDIERLCRCFLWTGKSNPSKKALVSWQQVCLPKEKGGLHIMDLVCWNQAAITKVLWDIANKSDSLWVRWLHAYYIKRTALWDLKAPNKCSWNLKQILKARELVDLVGGWAKVTKQGRYSIKALYDCLRPEAPKVEWRRIVCNTKASPSSSFIAWLAIQQRLATKDRLLRWKIQVDPMCVLCHNAPEIVQHLFFQCSYSNAVWMFILQQLKFNGTPGDFDDEVGFLSRLSRRKTSRYKLLNIAFIETLSVIWKVRNRCVFDHVLNPCNLTLREILFRVASRVNDEDKVLLLM